jgi:steroid delta-isomerase-like uncharacterized protein
MYHKILLLFSVWLIAACHPSTGELQKIATDKIEAMNRHDLGALGKLYADSATIESIGFEKIEIGPAGIQNAYTRYFSSTPDLKFEVTKLTLSDQSAVIEYTSTGTMRQSELEATIPDYMIGKKYTLKNATRIDIKNGKIIREMTYFDQLSFLRQMGFFEQGRS